MNFRSFYKHNIKTIKYIFVILNIILFINTIKAFVNLQKIFQSTEEVIQETQHTQEHTDYINNFLKPYLESDYAPYFLAHKNNQIFPGEKIISIITRGEQSSQGESGQKLDEFSTATQEEHSSSQARNQYRQEIFSSITFFRR